MHRPCTWECTPWAICQHHTVCDKLPGISAEEENAVDAELPLALCSEYSLGKLLLCPFVGRFKEATAIISLYSVFHVPPWVWIALESQAFHNKTVSPEHRSGKEHHHVNKFLLYIFNIVLKAGMGVSSVLILKKKMFHSNFNVAVLNTPTLWEHRSIWRQHYPLSSLE